MSSETRYCLCCGEESPTNKITRNDRVELTCAYCGFFMGTVEQRHESPKVPSPSAEPEVQGKADSQPESEPEPEQEQQPEPPAAVPVARRAEPVVPAPQKKKPARVAPVQPDQPDRQPESDCIIVCDDAELTRGFLNATLINRKLTQQVISTENGQEFIKVFTKRLSEQQPVNLVILDLEMPVMNGVMAARVMRAVEQKVGAKPVPILFFSGRKCDEELRKQLSIFSPAIYVNKGSETDPAKLMGRIDRLVEYLLENRSALPS